jgi:hypothetical protein
MCGLPSRPVSFDIRLGLFSTDAAELVSRSMSASARKQRTTRSVACRDTFRRQMILPDGQITSLNQKSCQGPRAKIFLFHFSEIHDYSLRIPPPSEGRIAIVTDVGSGMRWTQGGSARLSRRRKHPRGRPSRVVLIPRRWDQVLGDDPRAMEAIKPGTPGRARSSR